MKKQKKALCAILVLAAMVLSPLSAAADGESALTVAWPTAGNIRVRQVLADSVLTGGSAYAGGTAVSGVFTWEEEEEIFTAAGTYTRLVLFTPSDASGGFESTTGQVTVTVLPFAVASESDPPRGSGIRRGAALSASVISGTMCNPLDGSAVAGTYSWLDKTQTFAVSGVQTAVAVFTPDRTAYPDVDPIDVSVSVTVWFPATLAEGPAAADLYTGHALQESALTGGRVTNPAGGGVIAGSWTWKDPAWTSQEPGTYTQTAVFVPDDAARPVGTEASVSVRVLSTLVTPVISQLPAVEGTVFVGDALSAYSLRGGAAADGAGNAVPGVFQWAAGAAAPAEAGDFSAQVIFTPTDTNTYASVTLSLPLTARARVLSNTAVPDVFKAALIGRYFSAPYARNPAVMAGALCLAAAPEAAGAAAEAVPICLTYTVLPAARVGVPYTAALETNTTGVSWSAEGALPAWLVLAPEGALSGSPTESGEIRFVFMALNTAGYMLYAFSLPVSAS